METHDPKLVEAIKLVNASGTHVVVPVEPTMEMLSGACSKHEPGKPMRPGREECYRIQNRRNVWAKMLTASKQQP